MSFSIRCFAVILGSVALARAANSQFVDGQAAWAIYGQPYAGASSSPPSQTVTGTAGGVAWANGKLLVSEGNRIGANSLSADGTTPTVGNRATIFDTTALPDTHSDVANTGNYLNTRCPLCGFPASTVIGQVNFTNTSVGVQASDSAGGMRNPIGIATDGTVVAVADTDNNRVLIWKSFPTTNGQQPNVVLGQSDFNGTTAGTTNNTLRGPQGVWIQNGKLMVADTQNHRVLIWNSIPSQNQQAADQVLGQKDFNLAEAPSASQGTLPAAANRLYSPSSVTSDGTHLIVTDLGFNRVLIWNTLPTSNDQPADLVIGQPDFTSRIANNVTVLCAPAGTDSSGNPIYPSRCATTLSFPRYALSDGSRLYVADGGNDRVLIWNTFPTTSAAAADVVLGQPDVFADVVSDPTVQFGSTTIPNRASTDTIRTPTSLAFDGSKLYVTDPYDLRVMIFVAADNPTLGATSVLNAASLAIYQEGVVALGGSINANDTVSITINNTKTSVSNTYTYTVKSTDTLNTVAQGLADLVNANQGDPSVVALAGTASVLLTSRQSQLPNNTIALSTAVSSGAQITSVASSSYLTGGNAAIIAAGTIVAIDGQNLTNGSTDAAPENASTLPTSLAGAQVYMDGIRAPLLFASPTQIRAQVPYTFSGSNSASVYVRTSASAGTTITDSTGIIIAPANPGIFAGDGNDPRPAMAVHGSDHGSAVVSVDGTVKANDTATITIAGRGYTYTVQASDTLATIRDALINQINSSDPNVTASAGGQFTRVVLTAKASGPAGDGISVSTSTSSGASVILTAYTSSTCCASTAGAPVTPTNPAQPNETIIFYTTGLGDLGGNAAGYAVAGLGYGGPVPNAVTETVSSTIGARTGQVIDAGLTPGAIGVYQVSVIMPSGLPADANTQVYIAQDAFISNIVTLPLAGSASSLITFTANPSVIVAPAGTKYGATTLTWNATGIQSTEIHINAPDGPLFVSGGSSGSAATANWVNDNMAFYLEDVSGGKAPGVVNTLAVLHVRLGTPQDVTTFTATEVDLPPGYNAGPSTLSWDAPTATNVEVHVNAPNGPLFTSGGPQGTATTGYWVSSGTTFYLQDVSNGLPLTAANTLKTVSPAVRSVKPVFTITNPVPALFSPYRLLGTATMTWDSPLSTSVEVHVNAPNGSLMANGGPQGTATTGAWVTDGMTFYLQDVSGGRPLTAANTLNTVTAHVVIQYASGYLLAAPVAAGQSAASTTLAWSATNTTFTEIHIGAPNGPLFTAGDPNQTATTGNWVTDGMTFFLQDASNGQPLTSQFTIAAQTVRFGTTQPGVSFQASSNPIIVQPGAKSGVTTLYWSAPSTALFTEVHVGSPNGPAFAAGGPLGNATTGNWVTEGMVFYLQDVSGGKPLTSANTLGTVTCHLLTASAQ
jgi:uncharacterized protein (TIGR03437 family)